MNLLEQASKIGLVDSENDLHSTKEYEDFVCYLTTTRATRKFMRFLKLGDNWLQNDDPNPITLAFNDILGNFSHQKLEGMCKNQCFKGVLEFYLEKSGDSLFSGMSASKRQAYQSTLQRILELTKSE